MKALLNKALQVCDSAEVYCREIFSTSASIRLGTMQNIESEKKTEISLRVVKDGNMGSAVATSLEDETILERALISLAHQKSEPIIFPNEMMNEVICYSKEVQDLTTDELVNIAFGISDRLKVAAPDVATGVDVTKTVKTVKMINSSDFANVYDYTNISLGMFTINDQGFFSESKEYSSSMIPQVMDKHIDKLIQLHRLGEKPVTLENERIPVIFTGNVMGALMLRVVGGVNGGNIIKDISPLKDKIGTKVFSDKITIRDDGSMPFGCNSCCFDDEGTRARNTLIFENGVLKNYLLSIGQAKKLDMMPTGNAIKRTLFSKEIEDAPAVFDTNLVIEGDSVPDDSIIKSIKRGLLITGVMGAHTGNINQGEFSLNISSGYLIENGELVGKVKGSMIAGNIYDLFQKVEAIGSEYEVMRSIFYTMGYSPMVLFSEANIIGK
jgi:PmbA protein